MAYNPVPTTFYDAGVTTSRDVRLLDANFTYVSGKVLSVKDFGAVGDGVTDDGAAINTALQNCPAGGVVILPGSNTQYYTTVTIVVPPNRTLMGWWGVGSIVTQPAVSILASLSLALVVEVQASGSSQGCVRNLGINRVAGAVPASCIALQDDGTNYPSYENLYIMRHAVGLKLNGTVGANIDSVITSQITDKHWLLNNTVQLNAIRCSAGRNGGLDVSCNAYLSIQGASDTLRFTQCQYNQTAGSVTAGISFDNYSSPNGIIQFNQCHFELCTKIVTKSGTTATIQRLGFDQCTINPSGGGPAFHDLSAGVLTQFTLSNSPFIRASLTLDTISQFAVHHNNFVLGNVTITAGEGSFDNNNGSGLTLTINGTATDISANNNTGFTVATTATGKASVYGSSGATKSWTPTLAGTATAGTNTYAASTQGYAIRIGNLVFLHNCRVTLTALDGALAGNVYIGGLPWTPAAATGGAITGGITITAWDNITLTAGYTQLHAGIVSGTNQLLLLQSGSGAAVAAATIPAASLTNTTSILFSGVYLAA